MSSKAANQDFEDMDVLCTFKIYIESKIQNTGVPKTSDPIHIRTKMPSPSQEPPASSNAPNQDLKDMDVLCTLKIKMESQIWNMDVPKTSDHIQTLIKIPTPFRKLQHPP